MEGARSLTYDDSRGWDEARLAAVLAEGRVFLKGMNADQSRGRHADRGMVRTRVAAGEGRPKPGRPKPGRPKPGRPGQGAFASLPPARPSYKPSCLHPRSSPSRKRVPQPGRRRGPSPGPADRRAGTARRQDGSRRRAEPGKHPCRRGGRSPCPPGLCVLRGEADLAAGAGGPEDTQARPRWPWTARGKHWSFPGQPGARAKSPEIRFPAGR